jgi:hypothetical protein
VVVTGRVTKGYNEINRFRRIKKEYEAGSLEIALERLCYASSMAEHRYKVAIR